LQGLAKKLKTPQHTVPFTNISFFVLFFFSFDLWSHVMMQLMQFTAVWGQNNCLVQTQICGFQQS